MLTAKQRTRMCLDAIYDARRRAREANGAGDTHGELRIMGDLTALHVCLVGEVQMLLDELDKMKPYLIKGGKS